MRKTILIIFLVSIFVFSACTQKRQTMIFDNSNMEQIEDQMMGDVSSNIKDFTIHGSSFEFDKLELKVKKGDRVRITFISDDIGHNLFIDEFNVRTNVVSKDSSETVEFVADKEGTFDIYCNVGQHRQLGMESKLIVEP